jgi:hypothetical protein
MEGRSMNTEDRLHRASQEIERATASLAAPPLGEVRRSARMRGLGIAAATAVGAIVLVGGALLTLNPGGEALPGPVGPGVTTTTTTIPTLAEPDLAFSVTYASDDANLVVEPDGTEVAFQPITESQVEVDLAAIEEMDDSIVFTETEELVVIGRVGDLHFYVRSGVWKGGESESNLAPRSGECFLIVADGSARVDSCVSLGELDSAWMGSISLGLENELVTGHAPAGSAFVAVGPSGDEVWQRTRGGYWAVLINDPRRDVMMLEAMGADGSVLQGPVVVGLPDELAALEGCSGFSNVPQSYPRDDLPRAVSSTVDIIIVVAANCDFDTLEAVGGDNFAAGFGGDDPSELWTYEEEQGYEPMYWLMSILDLPHGTVETENGTLYVWPAASAHEGDWETTPAADVAVLESLYSEEQMQGFADFGAYIGYRVGIWEDGDWSFFVAGD